MTSPDGGAELPLIALENAAWSADCCRCSVVRARAGGAAGPPSFLLPFFLTGGS